MGPEGVEPPTYCLEGACPKEFSVARLCTAYHFILILQYNFSFVNV
jgi:hypothetical protein